MVGLCFSNHGNPRIISLDPVFVTKAFIWQSRPSMIVSRSTYSVISPWVFAVPSTLSSGILWESRCFVCLCWVTKLWEMKFPCAPESSRAVMATGREVFSLLILIGRSNARLFCVVSSCTRFRSKGSEEEFFGEFGDAKEAHRAVDLCFKNPRMDACVGLQQMPGVIPLVLLDLRFEQVVGFA